MKRIKDAFAKKVKAAYLTAGDNENSLDYFLALTAAGINLLEVGVPFSDPVADGVAIQDAMTAAIARNITIHDVLAIVKKIRARSEVAIVLFTYFNPIVNDLENYIKDAKDSGVDGILVVDLPYEESGLFRRLCLKYDVAPIFIASVATKREKVKLLSASGEGFLYYACRSGVTGVRNKLPEAIAKDIKALKDVSLLPILVGFGISNNTMVKAVLDVADGVVIGSYLVEQVTNKLPVNEFQYLVMEMIKC